MEVSTSTDKRFSFSKWLELARQWSLVEVVTLAIIALIVVSNG